jgi:hypothetical protein
MADPTSPDGDADERADAPAEDDGRAAAPGESTPAPPEEGPDDAPGETADVDAADTGTADGPDTEADASEADDVEGEADDVDALRERVEAEYDFEEFGPEDMAEMSPEEWSAAFDEDSWVTGADLLDRVEADLRSRVATRDVFAVVERTVDDRLVAYSDSSYAVVYPDGSVEGEGTVLQDVKPTVALASMPDYDVPDPPADGGLPAPEEVGGSDGQLGNNVLQVLGLLLGVAGLVLVAAPFVTDVSGAAIIAVLVGAVFVGVGAVLLFTVANARLSARYRAEEFRDRLRGAGVEEGERPGFLPVEDAAFGDAPAVSDGEAEDGEDSADEDRTTSTEEGADDDHTTPADDDHTAPAEADDAGGTSGE